MFQMGVFQLSQKRRRPGGVGGSSPQLTSLSDSTEIHPFQMYSLSIFKIRTIVGQENGLRGQETVKKRPHKR